MDYEVIQLLALERYTGQTHTASFKYKVIYVKQLLRDTLYTSRDFVVI
jgi:hypothetical protein